MILLFDTSTAPNPALQDGVKSATSIDALRQTEGRECIERLRTLSLSRRRSIQPWANPELWTGERRRPISLTIRGSSFAFCVPLGEQIVILGFQCVFRAVFQSSRKRIEQNRRGWTKNVHSICLAFSQVPGLRGRFKLKLHPYGKPIYRSVHRENLQTQILRDDSRPLIMEGKGFLSDHL